MRRNMDLVRELLIKISDGELDQESLGEDAVLYHLDMLKSINYIEGINIYSSWDGNSYSLSNPRLTWDGNEFLETIRPKGIWEKIKSVIQEKGLGITIDTITKVAPMVVGAALSSNQ